MEKHSSFSESLRQAVADDFLFVEADLPRLSAPDVETLQAILTGKMHPPFTLNLKRALGALARSDRSETTTRILGSVLADAKQSSRIRAFAAFNLGQIGSPEGEKSLLKNLGDGDKRVVAAVIGALGKTGGPEALAALGRFKPQDISIQKRMNLALTALQFRTNSDETPSIFPDWDLAQAKPIPEKEVARIVENLGETAYGIRLGKRFALSFSCGATENYIVFNETLQGGSLPDAVRSGKWIAGLVASDQEHGYVAIRYLILTYPGKAGPRLAIANAAGEVLYAGEIEGTSFFIRDVAPGVRPAEIRGDLGASDLGLRIRTWRMATQTKKRPLPIG